MNNPVEVTIISIYSTKDIHCTNGAIRKYLYINGECVLSGNDSEHVLEKIIGAMSTIYALGIRPHIERIDKADSDLFYEYHGKPKELFDHIVGEKPDSMYGNFG